jgi:phage tail sheath gpL-like
LTITGPASSQGVVSLWVGNTRVDVAVSAADTATLIAAAMKTAIDNQPELPVTAICCCRCSHADREEQRCGR